MAITTQKLTPLPKGTSRDCQVAPVQVTTLDGQCHRHSWPGHPTAPATRGHYEDQTMPLTVLGNLALNFPREKESGGRCMTSLGELSCRMESTWKHPRHPGGNDCNYGESFLCRTSSRLRRCRVMTYRLFNPETFKTMVVLPKGYHEVCGQN